MHPSGTLLGLFSALSFGVGDFIGGTAARRAGVFVVVAGAQLVGFTALLVSVLIVRPPVPGLDGVIVALLAGLAGAVGLAGLFGGMAIGSMGIVAALSGAGSLVVPLVAGAAMGARVAPLQLAGVACAALAALAASGASRDELGRRALLLAGVAAAGFGAWYVLLDLAADAADPLWTLVLSRSASTAVTVAIAVRRFRRPGYPFRLVVASGVLDIGGNAFFLAASTMIAVGLAAALTGLYPIVTMLLARAFLGERLPPVGIVGVALAVSAVVLISVGG